MWAQTQLKNGPQINVESKIKDSLQQKGRKSER